LTHHYVALCFQKSRKNYYAVLCERALELHESEKTYRKRKSALHLIDLSQAFNLHNEHFDPKLKKCVCLMLPDETLCPLIPSRFLRLGRPIQPQEFFGNAYKFIIIDLFSECAWDVEVVTAPKLKRPPGRPKR
uniref:Reverse transcriptase domain-containing protein n=1 Tax=Haemonchus placei TaxID=6290 RepID=A0A0N4WC93_HAEPC